MTLAVEESVRPIGWWAIVEELARMRREDGRLPGLDDDLQHGQLHAAAQCYLKATDVRSAMPRKWLLSPGLWRPGDRATNLVRAGALLLAETERLERAGKPVARHLRLAAMAVAEGLSKLIDRGPVPAPREDPRP